MNRLFQSIGIGVGDIGDALDLLDDAELLNRSPMDRRIAKNYIARLFLRGTVPDRAVAERLVTTAAFMAYGESSAYGWFKGLDWIHHVHKYNRWGYLELSTFISLLETFKREYAETDNVPEFFFDQEWQISINHTPLRWYSVIGAVANMAVGYTVDDLLKKNVSPAVAYIWKYVYDRGNASFISFGSMGNFEGKEVPYQVLMRLREHYGYRPERKVSRNALMIETNDGGIL